MPSPQNKLSRSTSEHPAADVRRPQRWRLATLLSLVLVVGCVTPVVAGTSADAHASASQHRRSSLATNSATNQQRAKPRATQNPPYVRVIANQHVQVACLTRPPSYTVTLRNVTGRTATWQIAFPSTPAPNRYPQWAALRPPVDGPSPTTGTIRPRGTASLVVEPQGGYPCSGQTYHATLSISVPHSRARQSIPLTYTGTGPEPFVQVNVISNQNYSESCADDTPPPPSYTATLTNAGNERAFPEVLPVETFGPYSTPSLAGQIQLTPGQTWIDAGQTVTMTITPQSWIGCGPGTYHIKLVFNNVDWQGDSQTVILTDTIV